MPTGIESHNRGQLEQLHRAFEGPFRPADAAEALGLPQDRTRRLLAYLADRGWLTRVRRGLYTTVPLGASDPAELREDPWIIANSAFSPCYIGGWSACEHWGLTEQVFRDIVVITARAIRSTIQVIQGTTFRLKRRDEADLFGTKAVWRNRQRVLVSNPSRTIADLLDDPALGGGIRHVAQVLTEYLDGDHRDLKTLIDYIDRQGNRTAYKRLGYILEASGIEPDLVARAQDRISTGISSLDPSVKRKGTISKRWGLRVNVRLDRHTS